MANIMAKVVQTDLEEEEYRVFKELLDKERLSIREGLRLAVGRMVREKVKVDPGDPFLKRKPLGKSGLGDLSTKHDRYLYGKKRERDSSSTQAH
jgi:hypothetical protein